MTRCHLPVNTALLFSTTQASFSKAIFVVHVQYPCPGINVNVPMASALPPVRFESALKMGNPNISYMVTVVLCFDAVALLSYNVGHSQV